MLGVWREGSGRLLGKGKREGPKVKREGTSSDERGGRLRRDIYIYDKKGGQDCQKKVEDRIIFEVKKEAITEADYCCTFCCCYFREEGGRQRK